MPLDLDLGGKVALVTGAASGMGRAISLGYAAQGARVFAADRDAIGAAAVCEEARGAGGEADPLGLDVACDASISACIQAVRAKAGRLDILLNGAGVIDLQPLGELTRDIFQRVYSVNVEGVFLVMQASAPLLIGSGGGSIINIASVVGRRGSPDAPVYASSKSAVISATQAAAQQLAPHGVSVNAIAPGSVRTPMWDQIKRDYGKARRGIEPDSYDAMVATRTPMGRLADPADIVGLAIFLAHPMSRFITGQTINVDGGVHAH